MRLLVLASAQANRRLEHGDRYDRQKQSELNDQADLDRVMIGQEVLADRRRWTARYEHLQADQKNEKISQVHA